ncbi:MULTISPECIES: helix-turn-helix domain-containing protein [Mycobacteriaceae]|uniref:helix-turn-helix domain-containing protein n=1 Tax=Mycobacteriaceae TaxID=1762 RepID=UPI0009BFA817|nr:MULTISPECIES: helix-turn-helix domain-containing protein [Mycobacteriaceae]MCV7222956.1 helix-turn-helix domain-containing protein [Mycolicibacterium elephantis]
MSRLDSATVSTHTPRWLSTSQAAEYLGVSVNTVRNYIADGRLKVHRMGPKLLKFDRAELDRFVEGKARR